MKIRNQILIYFSTVIIILMAAIFSVIYVLFSEYREEGFQKRQFEKTKYTVGLISEFKEMSAELSRIMDIQDIHDFYDEKMLVYNSKKELVFSSIDSLKIFGADNILNDLSPSRQWIETTEGDYDVIGVYIENRSTSFYVISKAYDKGGYANLHFLRNTLLVLFFIIVIVIVIIALYLSRSISSPITALAEKLNNFSLESGSTTEIPEESSSYELKLLTKRFNDLLSRTHDAFAFQKHAINHISHELKTPIAILVSELERINERVDNAPLKADIDNQIHKAKSLGEIIKVLLTISKIESGQGIPLSHIRVDEMLFDIIQQLNTLNPGFYFDVQFAPEHIDEKHLLIFSNKMLIKQAFTNLLTNCISYSSDNKGEIKLDCTSDDIIRIEITNMGAPVPASEQQFLFHHFFRGSNSTHTAGFGLGLVLTQKIITHNQGTVTYSHTSGQDNTFTVTLPLAHKE